MTDLIKSEYIKGRHSLSRYSIVLLPLLLAFITILLMRGNQSQLGVYNFWYTLFLPVIVAFFSISLINQDKRLSYANLTTLPIAGQKIWLAKVITGWCYLAFANFILFSVSTISGVVFGSQFSLFDGLFAAFVLTLTWLWQLPLAMWLVKTFNASVTFLSLLVVNIFCASQDIAGGSFWYIPFAIPSRLMAPLIGVNPNGVPLKVDSPLWNINVLVPGIAITLFLAIVVTYVTTKKVTWRDNQ